ncbi:NF-X1-type zinc finger protein NFXL1 [Tanacetum coccineum]
MGRAPTSIVLSAEKNQGFNWRCSGCESVQLTSFKDIDYVCFYGKSQDPPSNMYLTPHSFCEPCGKVLDKDLAANASYDDDEGDHCHHRCVVQCHPSPCPPCKAFALPKMYPCCKKTITIRCSDQSQKLLLTCGQCCGKQLNCQRIVFTNSVWLLGSGSKFVGLAKAESVESGEKTSNMNINLFLAMWFYVMAMKHPRMK